MAGAREKVFSIPTKERNIKVTTLHYYMTIITAAEEMVTSPTAGTDSKMKSLLVVMQHTLATVGRGRQFHPKPNKHLS